MSRIIVPPATFSLVVDPNNAISFNGTSQYGRVLNSAVIDDLVGSSLTIEFWINRNGNQTGAGARLVSIGDGTNNTWIVNTDGTNYGTAYGLADYSGNDSYRFADTSYLTSLTWQHCAFVYDVNTRAITIYKNGAVYSGSVASQSGSNTLRNPAGFDIFLGSGGVGSALYKGSFAALRVWNVARSLSEISANYQKYLDPNFEVGLTSNFNFNEGSGTSSENTALLGNNMSLVGTPTWVPGPTLTTKDYGTPRSAVSSPARSAAGTRLIA